MHLVLSRESYDARKRATGRMRILLLLNGPRERYVGGADAARERKWREYCSPVTKIEVGYLPSPEESGGISRVYGFGTKEALSLGPLYPDRCVSAERDGFDAVIIHCFVDPGLRETRRRVRIPVIGPGEVTLRAGATLSRKIGITSPSDETLDCSWQYVRDLGVESHIIGIEPIQRPLDAYAQQDPGEMMEALLAAAQKLIQQGAEMICPSGLAYIPIRVSAAEASQRLGIPVLDPGLLSVRTAEMLVSALQRSD